MLKTVAVTHSHSSRLPNSLPIPEEIAENQPSQITSEQAITHYNQGVALQQQGQHLTAIEEYQKAIALNPDLINAYSNLGCLWVNLEKFDHAIAVFQQALTHFPDEAKLYHNLAQCYVKQGNLDAAIASYLQAIQKQPDLIETYFHLGKAFKKQGLPQVALQYFQQIIQLEPNSTLATSECAASLLEQNQLSEAMIYFQKIIQLEQPFIKAYCEAISQLKGTNELDQARIACGKFIQALQQDIHTPDVYKYFAETHFHLGNTLVAYRHYSQAEYYYKKAILADPNWVDPYLQFGNCLVKQKQFSQAAIYYHKALGLNSEQPEVYQKLTWLLEQQGKEPQKNLSKVKRFIPSSSVESTHPNCQGLDCPICLNRIFKLLKPTRLAENIYDCSQPQEIPLEEQPNSIIQVTNGRAWVAPQKSWWQVCNAIAILNPQNELLTDGSQFYPNPLPGTEPIDWNQHQVFSVEEFPPLEIIQGSVAVLSGLSGNVYFHWMVDILPRFQILQKHYPDWQSIDWFLVNSIQNSFQRETLQKLGIPEDRILESDQYPYIQAKQLIIPAYPGSVGWVQPWILEFHRHLFSDAIQNPNTNYPERIFISRKQAKYRKILNEPDVIAYLSEWGFVTVELESLSVEEQATLFAHAKVIVAPHGAGLTNLMFCQPETIVIELLSPHYIRHYYWVISQQLRLKHYYITGEPFQCYPLRQLMYQSPLITDIYVQIKSLEKIIEVLKTNLNNSPHIFKGYNLIKTREKPQPLENLQQGELTRQPQDTIQQSLIQSKPNLGSSITKMVTVSYSQNGHKKSQDNFSLAETKTAEQSLENRLTSLELFRLAKQDYQYSHSSDSLAVDISLKKAQDYFDQKDYQKVVSECQLVLQVNPKEVDAYHLLGKALQGLGKPEDALKWYQYVIKLKPNEAIVYANVGNLYAQLKQYKLAIQAYQKAIALQPDLALAHRNLGKVWSKIGKPEIAANCWYQAFSLQPKTIKPEEHLSLGNILFRQGKIQQAEICYRRTLEQNPHHIEAYHNLGELLAAQGKWKEAETFYQQAIQLNPKSFEPYNSLGKALVMQGKWEAVVACYRQALELNPRLLLALQNLTKALLHHNKGSLGSSDYRQVLLLIAGNLPPQPVLASGMGAVKGATEVAVIPESTEESISLQTAQEYYTQQNYERCLRYCQQLLQQQPQLVPAYRLAGKAWAGQNNQEKARLCYQKAIALQPQNEELYLELGDIYAQQQQWQQAIACYQRAIQLQPQAQAYRQLSDLWQTLGRAENAEDCLYEAFQLAPEQASIQDYLELGNRLWTRGQITQAMTCYRQVLDRDPQQALAHQRLAQGLHQKNQLKEAILHYHQAYQAAIQHQQIAKSQSPINTDSSALGESGWLAETQALLGDIYVQQQQWDEAIACYQEAVKLNPSLISIQELLADIWVERQDWEKAIATYRQILKVEPKAWQVYHKLGDAFQQQGNLADAIKAYRKATELARKSIS